MGRQDPPGLTFDSGALIAFEGRDRRVTALVQRAIDLGRTIVVPAGVVGQVWRGGGARQARLAILLGSKHVMVEDLTRNRAQIAGELCKRSGTKDVIDASVVLAAWSHGRVVVTSDPGDIRRLDPSLKVVSV
ncbi:MAG TPA: PIN domain-containing protein [Myxococcaceae bacterium]|nr:PIN domain-containing protein [Myxococcaceae bacterium]